MPKSSGLQELLRKLSVIQEHCYDIVIDLAKIEFFSDNEEMFIRDLITGNKYNFKMGKDEPLNAVKTNAQRQLCKRIGVPFNFFMDNRPVARNLMVKQWLAATAPESEDSQANLMMLRIREGGLTKVIRAILPVDYSAMSTHEIVNTLSTLKDPVEIDVDEDTLVGIERDALSTHIRLIYNLSIDLGNEYAVGLAITTSEVGTSDLIIDAFLYQKEFSTYAIALYGNKPFSTLQYAKVQPNEIQELLSTIPLRLEEEAKEYLRSIRETGECFPGFERAATYLGKIKGVPRKFQRSMLLEAQNVGGTITELEEFLTNAGMVAKGHTIAERTKIERAIGTFGGLRYNKK